MAVERGCLIRPELTAGLQARAEIRFTDDYPTVRITFTPTSVIIEDKPPDEPAIDPPGEAVGFDAVAQATEPETPPDPMLDTGVRMALFEPDVVVEGTVTDLLALATTPLIAGLPNITDARGRSAVASLATGRVKFRGSLARARQLTLLLRA